MKNFLSKSSLIILISFCIFLCFYNLSKHPVQQWDEKTNIAVVDETLSTNSPLTLKYQNEPFYEKPPIWYWVTIGITELFYSKNISGSNSTNTPYRLISALSGVGIVLTTYFISKKSWGHWAGIISGFALLSTGHLFINNASGYFSTHTFRSADLDALQIFFIIIGISFYLKHKRSPRAKNLNIYLVFLFSGLAIMTKGPLGVLPIVILLFDHPSIKKLYTLSNRCCQEFTKGVWNILKKQHVVPFSILLLTLLPWHIWMYAKFGVDFINKYFLYHIVKRAVESIEEHKEEFIFYIRMFWNLNVFAIGTPTIASIVITVKNKTSQKDIGVKSAILGILIPLILFTLIPTKLAWYNLYIYPFAALLTGYLSSQKLKNKYMNVFKNSTIIGLITIGVAQNINWILSLSSL